MFNLQDTDVKGTGIFVHQSLPSVISNYYFLWRCNCADTAAQCATKVSDFVTKQGTCTYKNQSKINYLNGIIMWKLCPKCAIMSKKRRCACVFWCKWILDLVFFFALNFKKPFNHRLIKWYDQQPCFCSILFTRGVSS